MGVRLSALMSSQLVYGDGVEDIKEFLSGTFSRGRRGEGGSLCSRPVILGAVLTIWLLALSISLIAVASKYQNLSVVSLSSRLDTVDSRHNSNHAKALERIGQVDSHHRQTIGQLGSKFEILLAIVDFLYLGEANIYQEHSWPLLR